MGRLVLDIHYVEHSGRKAHARRTPRTIELTLAQLIYINVDLQDETSYQTRTLLTSTERVHGSNKSRNLLVVHLRGQAPHGFIVGELHLIDKAIPSTLIYAHGGLAILAELFESIPKRIHMARGVLVKHAIVATSVKLAHARHGNLERVAALSRSLIYQLGNRNLAPNSMPGCTIVLAHQHVLIKPRIVVQIARATTNAVPKGLVRSSGM